MIKTGMVSNITLGVGDASKFDLLGGSFGKNSGFVTGGNGARRFLPSARDTILAAAAARAGGSGGSSSGKLDQTRPRYERER